MKAFTPDVRRTIPLILGAALALLLPLPQGEVEHAYVGPGAGFAVVGSFLALLTGMLLGAFAIVSWPFRVALRFFRARKSGRHARVKKTIFLGLDGLDPTLTEKYMSEGRLPNLRRLAQEGSYRRLRTTLPALSPVAWSTFATGVNPARHNIFDFLKREAYSYSPELSSSRVHPPRRTLKVGRYRIPLRPGWIEARRKSKSFWTILGEHQVTSTILRVPITFPPEKFNGRLLSAMSTPDLRGTQGTYTVFSTRASHDDLEQGLRSVLHRNGGILEGLLDGPPMATAETFPSQLPFRLRPTSADEAVLDIAGGSHRLRLGEYTPWLTLSFRCGPAMTVRGLARFLLTESGAEHSLYVSPINMDPEYPAMPISHPSYYSSYLAKILGSFATVGMAEDTWALNEQVIDESAFLKQAYLTFEERESMFLNALERTRHGVVACVFDTTDRVQHMFFRYLAPDSDPQSKHRNAIPELYERMDRLVGRALEHVDKNTAFFVLSDHGFTSFRRGINLNTWLLENGYLILETPNSEDARYLRGIDWQKTKAYALGLGGIYLNRVGREPRGIVNPGVEAETLKHEIISKLSELMDREKQQRAIRTVYASSAAYTGPYLDSAPDLVVGYAEGYRISWTAATGSVATHVFEDNDKAWSGDHCVDPALVPGVLFSNLPISAKDPGIEDMAPTALTLFGVTPPGWMEGKSLLDTPDPIPAR